MSSTHHSAKQWTILEILQWTVDFFKQNAVDSPRLTAEILLAHVLKQERMYLYVHFDQPLEQTEREEFKSLIRQRVQGVPTQYLTGRQEFWSLEFQVAPGVLIPRPETEHLVEAAVRMAAQFSAPKIVDIGTGSGIIAICLQHELPQATVSACDISADALAIACRNAEALLQNGGQIAFRHGDLFAPFAGQTFDLIVSNPPYISQKDSPSLAREVRDHEPEDALLAGEEGLDVYRRLAAEAASYLAPEGFLLMEIGYGQRKAVAELFKHHHFLIREIIKDYAGIERVLITQIR